MLLAAIGDIRGNLPALEAAMQMIDSRGIQTIVNTGNIVVGAPFPDEVIRMLDLYRVQSAMGDLDRYVANFRKRAEAARQELSPEEYQAIEWTHKHIRSRNIEYLRGLKRRFVTTLEGLSFCISHGCPTSPSDSLEADDDETIFRRQREYANVHVVVVGKASKPYYRFVDDTLFVCPGKLGVLDNDQASGSFAIINTETRPWLVTLEAIHYSRKRIAEQYAKLER